MFRDESTQEYLKMLSEVAPSGKVSSIWVRNSPKRGSSHTAQFIADQLGANVHSIRGTPQVCQDELIGKWEMDKEEEIPYWKEGIIPRAINDANRNGNAVLEIEELKDIQEQCQILINPLLGGDPCIRIPSKGFEGVCLNEDARLFLVAENTDDYLSPAEEILINHMLLHLENF